MSIFEIITGQQPFFKSQSMRDRLMSVEQDYALLASKGGGPFYLNRQCATPRYKRETGPSIEDIADPRGSIHQEAVDALLTNRQYDFGGANLTYSDFFKRLTFKLYTGPSTGTPTQQPAWVLSDDTPVGKWRVYVKATGNWHNPANNADQEPMILYMIPPGLRPVNSTTRDPFFVDYFDNQPLPPAGNNKGPLQLGLRVDQLAQDTANHTWAQNGFEVVLLIDPIVVPAGWALLGLQPAWNTTTDVQFAELRVLFADMDLGESLAFSL